MTTNEERYCNRIAELEAEIERMKRTTSEALEKSWEEAERLHREAEQSHLNMLTMSMHRHARRNSIMTDLQPDNKKQNTSGSIPDLMSISTVDTVNSSLVDDNSSQNWSFGNSMMTLPGVGSWGAAKRQAAVQTQIEKDLMRQLEVMQQDKIFTEDDLKMKLRQREAAIETLEGMVMVQAQTIHNLRKKMEEMKKRYEGETKVKPRKEDMDQISLRRLDKERIHRSPSSRADRNEPFATSMRSSRSSEANDLDRRRRKVEVRLSRGRSCARLGPVNKIDAFAERGRRGRSCESLTHSVGTKHGERSTRSRDECTPTSRSRREQYANNGSKKSELSTVFQSIQVPQSKSRSQSSSLNKPTSPKSGSSQTSTRSGSSSSSKPVRTSLANSTGDRSKSPKVNRQDQSSFIAPCSPRKEKAVTFTARRTAASSA